MFFETTRDSQQLQNKAARGGDRAIMLTQRETPLFRESGQTMQARRRPHRRHAATRDGNGRKGEKDIRVADVIDLSPLLHESDAAEMLLRARGQLNRAFRKHGLFSPDPLPLSDIVHVEAPDSDDPAADGIATARARYKGAFDVWAAEMPLTLARPVLEILRQTHEALSGQQGDSAAAQTAVMRAYDFLAARARLDAGGAGTA